LLAVAVRVQQPGDGRARPDQALAKVQRPVELLPVLQLPPVGVVEVLAAAGIVDAGGLDMPVRGGADPDVPPGRRDGQRLDAPAYFRIGQP